MSRPRRAKATIKSMKEIDEDLTDDENDKINLEILENTCNFCAKSFRSSTVSTIIYKVVLSFSVILLII